MKWNWQKTDWPNFSWQLERLEEAERRFLVQAGVVLGAVSHLDSESMDQLKVQLIGEEALTSSEIEGEILDRESVQSSIRRQLGLAVVGDRRVSAAEQGVAEMMVDLYKNFNEPLSSENLCSWHAMLMQGRYDLRDVGSYRTHTDPMQVVSGKVYDPTVHFEAPPSHMVPNEMRAFVQWFNDTSPSGDKPLPAVTRAGLAHLYFESIHPFEDGNGRIGRAISEKALAQCLGKSTLTAVAATILVHRKAYYKMLEASNKDNELTDWLVWFAGICLEAQHRTQVQIDFIVEKTKLLTRVRETLNKRQLKVLLRVLREGPKGFDGGLSASNYVTIAKTSPATARRDLVDLVAKKVFKRTGERRYARYHLIIPLEEIRPVSIDESGKVVS